jgi:GNAT superfamily N-acetyltransferase
MEFSLRPGTEADADFIMTVTETVMRGHIEKTWGQWDPAFQRDDFRKSFPHLEHSIIVCNNTDAGYLAVRRSDRTIFISKIYLLPSWQNCGIGSTIINGLIEEARTAGKPLQLNIVPVNLGAKRFYERLGFAATATIGPFIRMEYAATPETAST